MHDAVFTEAFIDSVASIYSAQLLAQLNECITSIRTFPLMGSANLRPSLRDRFGADIRKFPLPPFVIVYRYKEQEGPVEFLALPYDKTVQ